MNESLVTGFTFAFANSLHCAGMCGPLALLFATQRSALIGYHLARIASYFAVGTALGAAGELLDLSALAPNAALLSLFAGGVLAVFALGFDSVLHARAFHALPGLQQITNRVFRRARALSGTARGFALGFCTPLLPCGLLVAAHGAAVVSGDWQAGGATMFGFALGSLPALALFQVHGGWLRRTLGPRRLAQIARFTMLIAAVALIWRGVIAWQSESGASCCTQVERYPDGH